MVNKRLANELNKKIDKLKEDEFRITKKILKVLKRIINYAEVEKWSIYYLIEELEIDIKIWKEKLHKGDYNV